MERRTTAVTLLALLLAEPLFMANAATETASCTRPPTDHSRVIGALTCNSSMCHGGASPARYQYSIWSHSDLHSRAYASLVTAYGQNMAKAIGSDDATKDARCTTCHAPLAYPGADLASTADVTEGVTCESCHNGAGSWLRSHTRLDYSYQDRVRAGMKDMRDTFVRADTCVRCHQSLDAKIIEAGHPALTFELDGQAASEPRHWKEKSNWFGAKAWLVGQLVALNSVTDCVGQATGKYHDALVMQQDALSWLVARVPDVKLDDAAQGNLKLWSNQEAHSISDESWSEDRTQQAFAALAGTADAFRDSKVSADLQRARAERLVLGLDRLFKATHPQHDDAMPAGAAELTALFDQVREGAAFNAMNFANALDKFAGVAGVKKA
jgi:hypothetical protein